MSVHKSITEERVVDAMKRGTFGLDNPGFCIVCGADVEGIEPDARGDRCYDCGARAVYGAEEVLLMTIA